MLTQTVLLTHQIRNWLKILTIVLFSLTIILSIVMLTVSMRIMMSVQKDSDAQKVSVHSLTSDRLFNSLLILISLLSIIFILIHTVSLIVIIFERQDEPDNMTYIVFLIVSISCILATFLLLAACIKIHRTIPQSFHSTLESHIQSFKRLSVKGIIYIQSDYQCCGSRGPVDYTAYPLPESCCQETFANGTCEVTYTGCADKLSHWYTFQSVSLIVLDVILIVVQIVTVITVRYVQTSVDEEVSVQGVKFPSHGYLIEPASNKQKLQMKSKIMRSEFPTEKLSTMTGKTVKQTIGQDVPLMSPISLVPTEEPGDTEPELLKPAKQSLYDARLAGTPLHQINHMIQISRQNHTVKRGVKYRYRYFLLREV